MIDRKTFLRAILAGERGAREMFADWLEEQGEDDQSALWMYQPWPRTEALRSLLVAYGHVPPTCCLVAQISSATRYSQSQDTVWNVRRFIIEATGVKLEVERRPDFKRSCNSVIGDGRAWFRSNAKTLRCVSAIL